MTDERFRRLRLRRLLLGVVAAGVLWAVIRATFDVHLRGLNGAVMMAAFYGLLFMLGWWRCRAAGITLADIFGQPVRDGSAFLRPLAIAVPLLVFAAFSTAFTVYVVKAAGGEELIRRMALDRAGLSAATGINMPILAAVICLGAPLVEEFIFRGMVMRRIAAARGLWTGIVVSGLVFGLLHPLMPVGAAALGIVYGVLYAATGSLWISVVMHAVHNSLVLSAALGGSRRTPSAKELDAALSPPLATQVMAAVVALLLGALVLRLLAPYLDRLRSRGAAYAGDGTDAASRDPGGADERPELHE